MDNKKLAFKLTDQEVVALESSSFKNERELQSFCEKHLKSLFGITFLQTEFSMVSEGCRIDTLGIDQSCRPVIIEYKLNTASSNIINQGRSYRKYLTRYKLEVVRLAKQKLTRSISSDDIKFNHTRVICVAQQFDKFIHPDQNRDVELITYEFFKVLIIFNLLSDSSQARINHLVPALTADKDSGSKSQTRNWFYNRANGRNAQIRQDGNIFTVLKGSYISAVTTPALIKARPGFVRWRDRRVSNLDRHHDLYLLDEDESFPSEGYGHQYGRRYSSGINQACMFIWGLSASPYTQLKNEDGLTVNEVIKQLGVDKRTFFRSS